MTDPAPPPHATPPHDAETLADFTTTPRVLTLGAFSIGIGVVSAYVALGLLTLIALFTNLFFFQRVSTSPITPESHALGPFVIVVPVVGALIIGVMARYGSERIRGHGIPEAIEAILMNGSRVEPKVALLKPLSSAISIGSGGPFGAEGPIIMTGGAVGSLIAQFLHLTSAERKTLLVAGAAAGMSATFATPLAAVTLAVELLLFEWKPRSLIPVALASATAATVRRYLIGLGPLFVVTPHPAFIGPEGLAGCVIAGVLAGALSAVLTQAVYAAEDGFQRLPMHWMWWPMFGGLVIGIGGWLFPQALGVGYDVIASLLQGEVSGRAIVGILAVKSIIWSVALGSGTSGGVLAPLLMMGGALGGVEGWFLPAEGPGFWPLVSMGAILGGTMRSPLTGVIFSLELTHDFNMTLPLLVAVTVAHGFTVLVLKRSILTEKIARRGLHLSREYAIDPLEVLCVREVMRTNVAALPADAPIEAIRASLGTTSTSNRQRLYPVVGDDAVLVGAVTREELRAIASASRSAFASPLAASLTRAPVVAHPDEPLRAVAHRMAGCGLTRFPVVERRTRRLVGMIALRDLLTARSRHLDAEHRRERVLAIPTTVRFGRARLLHRPRRERDMEEKHRVPKDEVDRDRSDDRPLREGDVLGVSDTPPEVEIPRATTDRGGHPAGIEVRERTSGNSELRQTPGATGIDMGAGGSGTGIEPPRRRSPARDNTDE